MTKAEAKAAYRERMMQAQAEAQLRRAIAEKARLADGTGAGEPKPPARPPDRSPG